MLCVFCILYFIERRPALVPYSMGRIIHQIRSSFPQSSLATAVTTGKDVGRDFTSHNVNSPPCTQAVSHADVLKVLKVCCQTETQGYLYEVGYSEEDLKCIEEEEEASEAPAAVRL